MPVPSSKWYKDIKICLTQENITFIKNTCNIQIPYLKWDVQVRPEQEIREITSKNSHEIKQAKKRTASLVLEKEYIFWSFNM